jgi:hypothetical protein
MTPLQYITLIIFVATICLGFYINLIYSRMSRDGIVEENRRVSLKILNEAIVANSNTSHLPRLQSSRKLHIIYLWALGISLLLVGITIAMNIK